MQGKDFETLKTELLKALKSAGRKVSELFAECKTRFGYRHYMAAAGVILALILLFELLPALFGSADTTDAFVASTGKDAAVYLIGRPYADAENGKAGTTEVRAVGIRRLVRGTPVKRYRHRVVIDDVSYIRIADRMSELKKTEDPYGKTVFEKEKDDFVHFYVREDDLASSKEGVVKETEVYVRTPVTIYAEESGPAIASFAAKGSCLPVKGYDRMNTDGSVNKYKVEYTEDGETHEGYVYGKYLTDSQESADAVYNENGVYDKAVKDRFSFNLYGGKASHLDFYPYEKPVIEGKKFCRNARTMYLNCAAVVSPKSYIKIIDQTDCNAVVCDIKDGVLAYKSEVAKELSPRSYKTAYTSKKKYRKGIDALKKTGVYTIGRIVVFNDPIYAKDHPEDCIKYRGNSGWPSAYSRDVWEYNVRLAQEAIREFGFDEIQFDYVRFPESSYDMSKSGKAKFRNKYGEEKGQAVQNFCFYAADQIHEAGAYFSIDVFGECAYGYMTSYGQYWPGLSNIVDAISAMPYTDHMGEEGAWVRPYRTVKAWAKKAKKMQKRIENPAAARTWITGYDTPYWGPTENYGYTELMSQVEALKAAGLKGGFIPWNSGSSVAKYKQYRKVWNK